MAANKSKKKGNGSGRYTRPAKHAGSATGKYLSPEARGAYTAPLSRYAHQSPPWYGWAVVGVFVVGLVSIVLNYLNALPGGTSVWYLFVGILIIFAGFALMMRYH